MISEGGMPAGARLLYPACADVEMTCRLHLTAAIAHKSHRFVPKIYAVSRAFSVALHP